MAIKTAESAAADIKAALFSTENAKELQARSMLALLAIPDLQGVSDRLYDFLEPIQKQIKKISDERYYAKGKEPLLEGISGILAEQRRKITELQGAIVERNLIQINEELTSLLESIKDCKKLINQI